MRTLTVAFPEVERAELVETEIPGPGPDEVTVEASFTLISTGTELICFRGECDQGTHWAQFMGFPHHPGYSCMGRVVRVGEDVEGVSEGERVCATARHQLHNNVRTDRLWCAPVPEAASDEEAAWVSLAVITQTGVRQAEHVMGDRALVIGLGPLGQLVTQYLQALGLGEVMVADRVQWRVDVALAHGATAGLCAELADARGFVEEHTGGELADVVYDVTGHWSVLPQALPLARDHGKLILLGDSPFPTRQHLTDDVVSRQVRVIGSRSSWLPPAYSHWTPQRQAGLFMSYLQRGQMRVGDLITHRFSPEQAAEVYPMLASEQTGVLGVVFDWGRLG
ncbi:MAG TPA: zinc-binding dehydrogenase [Armatimonadota bacterium]|nr:zinc-binding dehydrogenase [Armatimonadota bacterium]